DAVELAGGQEVAGLVARGAVGRGDAADVLAVGVESRVLDDVVLVGVVVAGRHLTGESGLGGRVDGVDRRRVAVVQPQGRMAGVQAGVDDGDDHAGAVDPVGLEGGRDAVQGAGGVLGALVDPLPA